MRKSIYLSSALLIIFFKGLGQSTSSWQLSGNAGTDATQHFVGTTDAQDLIFKTNNTERLRLNAGGTLIYNAEWSRDMVNFSTNNAYAWVATNSNSVAGGVGYRMNMNGGVKAQLFHCPSNFSNGTVLDVLEGNADILSRSGDVFLSTGWFKSNGLTVKNGTGNVGIGTTSPGARLETNGTVRVTNYTTPTAGEGLELLYDNANGIANIYSYNRSTSTYRALNLNDKIRILPNGYTGLGTGNPQSNLHIYGTNPGIFLEGDENSYYPYIRMKSQGGDGVIDNYNVTNGLAGGLCFKVGTGNGNGALSLGVVPSRGVVSHSTDPSLVTHNVVGASGQTADLFQVSQYTPEGTSYAATPLFRVTAAGKVGIGVSDPGRFKLAVEGYVGVRKLVVTQNANWADYVFNDGYKLPTLNEVETYIKKHKHLPGVVTEAEVEKDGLDVGENQATLLKKIEELTLYVIELKKEIDGLKRAQ